MTIIQPSEEELLLFSKLFCGYEKAYGEYQIDRTESSGKQLGKAVTHPCAASLSDYKQHLAGVKGIGIIPLLLEDHCWFGAIDIDIKGATKLTESHESLEAKVRRFKLPLMMFRSKSNGAHLYLFGKERISARLIQARLAEFAAILGYGGCEVFPKQVTRLKNDGTDYGNWINIPLHGESRVGLFEGVEVSKLQALKTCEYLAVTEEELREFNVKQSGKFSDGPPCLQTIATIGVGEGNRNNTLFNMGVYFRSKYPEDFQEHLTEYNEESVDPPLGGAEMRGLFAGLTKKGYFYTCTQAPICNFCDKKKCAKRKYGIGFKGLDEEDEGHHVLPITSLTKYIAGDRQSYRWGVGTTEAMLEFTTEEFLNIEVHRKKFAELLNTILPPIKMNEFRRQLQEWMNKAEVVYDPEDASASGELMGNIESWFNDKGGARNVDEMMKRIWWSSPENGNTYFILDHLIDYLMHQKKMKNIPRHDLSRFLQTRFKAQQDKLLIKKKRRNVYVIKDLFIEDNEPYDVPDVVRKEDEI